MYVGEGSLWLWFFSDVPLCVDGLLSIIDKFIQKRRAHSLSWAFAESPRQVAPFAAPGLHRLGHMLEALRGKLDVPRVVQLKGSFFKGLALSLARQVAGRTNCRCFACVLNQELACRLPRNLRRDEKVRLEGWQVHVVSNGIEVEDDEWLLRKQMVLRKPGIADL